jgi:amidase
MTIDWKAVRDRKQADRQARLPAKWLVPEHELPGPDVQDTMDLCATRGWLSKEELSLTGMTVSQLVDEIKAGKVSAVEVVSAFAHRATIAQQLLNPYVTSMLPRIFVMTLTRTV